MDEDTFIAKAMEQTFYDDNDMMMETDVYCCDLEDPPQLKRQDITGSMRDT